MGSILLISLLGSPILSKNINFINRLNFNDRIYNFSFIFIIIIKLNCILSNFEQFIFFFFYVPSPPQTTVTRIRYPRFASGLKFFE